MRSTIPERMKGSPSESNDLTEMQAIYLDACRQVMPQSKEGRAAIAIAILDAYERGERDHNRLLDAALAAKP